jgi:AAA-like domain
VRHRDPEPGPGLAVEAAFGHLVITHDRVIAYYKVPLHRWSFRPEDERLAVIAAAATSLSQLVRRRCHLRITSRPFEVWQWAEALDASIRGPFSPDGRAARQVMPGPCALHPERSEPTCRSCVPGSTWLDWLQAQQRRLRQWGITDRDVYLGVEVTSRGAALRALGQAWDWAAGAERTALADQAAKVNAAVEGTGLGARPVTPAELQWLFIRSCGLGLPAPLPVSEDPAPFPFAAPAAAPTFAGGDELDAYMQDFAWGAEPFGKTVQVRRDADGLTAHVAALTLTAMTAAQDLASDSPWIQRTDRLPFPVEWSITFDVLDPRRVQQLMNRQADKIRAQFAHIVDEHGQDPPAIMERQMSAVRRIEAEAENPEAAGTYVWAWPRMAVAGATEQEALQRARQVAELYAPGMTVKTPPDQYRVLREFIPGEPLASAANKRFLHAEMLMAGAPAATAEVGHRHGFPIGVTSSLSCRAVTWHPWHAMEKLNRSGLVTITGTLGGGKSTVAGLLAYMSARAGIPTTVLDPKGMMDRLCGIPALRNHALSVNLLESPPGTLCPYSLVPEPVFDDFLFDERGHRRDDNAAGQAWHNARSAAEVQRRVLCEDILKMLLPDRILSQPGTDDAIGEAVRLSPAGADASPRDVITALWQLSNYGLADRGPLLAGRLETYAAHPLSRLFFPPLDGDAAAPSAGRLLTVMTLGGLVIPGPDRRPEDRSVDEQLSVPVLHLAAQLLRRMLLDLPRASRKAAFLDEAHALTRDPVGQNQVREMARDSRKHNLLAVYISQNPQDLLEAGIDNLRGAAFAFRTEGTAEQAATCGLLGLPTGHGYEGRLAGLSRRALAGGGMTGECLFRDGQGGLEQVQIDLGSDPDLRAALNTTPGAAVPVTQPGAPS